MHTRLSIEERKRRVKEVLHNLNWLMEAHNSFAELVDIKGDNVIVRTEGHCADCETGCVKVAFDERMPDINLILE